MTDTPVPSTPGAAALDRTERGGSTALVVFLSVFLVATLAAFFVLPRDDADRLTIGILALLAVVGIVGLFFYAVGLIQPAGQRARHDITRRIADSYVEGLLATEGDNRVLYANEIYMGLSGGHSHADIRTVDRLFSGTPEVSESIYRLAQAAREGKRAAEELRLSPPLAGAAAVGWYRIRVRPLEREGGKPATLWSVADVTRERERHENVFQELQHAIDFLDHAPAGFFSANSTGAISYMNATLAGWLDYDLAQVGSGGLRLSDIVAGDGAALLASIHGGVGEVKTEQFDVDLKRRNGQNLPARLLHRIAFGHDRGPGASRTLVLNRAPGEEKAEDLRAAEVRFARFFNSTPMAIATLDTQGRIARSNAAFARLMPQALAPTEPGAARAIFAGLSEKDRPALARALADAAAGRGEIAPIDATIAGEPGGSARLFLSPAEETDGAAATLFALDTTEQRALQDGFAQSQKMQAIGELAGGVAHDFNNVLTAIIGYSDLLLAQHRPTDPSFQDIMQIRQNANRAAGLVRQLLAFSRRQTLLPEVLQMGDVLSDLQILLRRLAGEKIELELRHGRDLWLVKADHNQFEQVIINLVVNARDAIKDAMPDGGKSSCAPATSARPNAPASTKNR